MAEESKQDFSQEPDMEQAAQDDPIGTRYVKVDVIARYFGVTVRRVQQLTQEGILTTTQVARGRRYDLSETIKAYIQYLSDRTYGRTKSKKETELREQKLEAEVALKDSQTELHRMKMDIAAGKYIEREEVELDYQKFFVSFKRFALNIPTRLISMLSDQVKPTEARRAEQELTEEVKRMLRAFVVSGIPVPENTEPEPVKRKRTGAKTRTAQAT